VLKRLALAVSLGLQTNRFDPSQSSILIAGSASSFAVWQSVVMPGPGDFETDFETTVRLRLRRRVLKNPASDEPRQH